MVQVIKYKGGSFYDPVAMRSGGGIAGDSIWVWSLGFRIVFGVKQNASKS